MTVICYTFDIVENRVGNGCNVKTLDYCPSLKPDYTLAPCELENSQMEKNFTEFDRARVFFSNYCCFVGVPVFQLWIEEHYRNAVKIVRNLILFPYNQNIRGLNVQCTS